MSKLSNEKHLLWRIGRHGFRETVWFTGSLRQKPTGWKVSKTGK